MFCAISQDKEEIEYKQEIEDVYYNALTSRDLNNNDYHVDDEDYECIQNEDNSKIFDIEAQANIPMINIQINNNKNKTISIIWKGITVMFLLCGIMIFIYSNSNQIKQTIMDQIYVDDIGDAHYNQPSGIKRRLFSDSGEIAKYEQEIKDYSNIGGYSYENADALNAALDYFKEQSEYTFQGTTYAGLYDDHEQETSQWLDGLIQEMQTSATEGTEFSFNGFRSTSKNPVIASKFLVKGVDADEGEDFGNSIYIQFIVNKAADITKLAEEAVEDEDEVLFGSNEKFIVKQVEQKNAQEFFNEKMEKSGDTRINDLIAHDQYVEERVKPMIEDGNPTIWFAVVEQVG